MEGLKREGWGRHTILVPGLVYWITIPPALYLTAIAAFAFFCPPFLAPVQHFCESRVWCGVVFVRSGVCGASRCAVENKVVEGVFFFYAVLNVCGVVFCLLP